MKSIKIICIKLIILIIPFQLIVPFAMEMFPMRFFDGEYSYYLENREYSEKHDKYCRVLIMGDSTAKASYLPTELSDDTYNFALGGASPIEEYYYLLDYLKKNEAPQYIIYMQGISHFLGIDTFWTRSVYFHRMNKKMLFNIIQELQGDGNEGILGKEDVKKEALLYEFYSPIKYGPAILQGTIFSDRYSQNIEKYKEVVEHKGQIQFGTADYCDEKDYCVNYDSFHVNEIIDLYFNKIIQLCEEKNIKFIFQNAPFNKSTYDGLQDGFLKDYRNYMIRASKGIDSFRLLDN